MRRLVSFVLCVLLFLMPLSAGAITITPKKKAVQSSERLLTLPDETMGMAEAEMVVSAPAAGVLELKLLGGDGLVRNVLTWEVSAGETALTFPFTAAFGQPLFADTYTVEGALLCVDGASYTDTCTVTLSQNQQKLLLVIPSSESLILGTNNWYAEVQTVRDGQVQMEAFDENGEKVATVIKQTQVGSSTKLYWNGRLDNGRMADPGRYTLRFSAGREYFGKEMAVYIHDEMTELHAPGITGPVLPKTDASDEEIWRVMMQPSVVAQGKINEKVEVKREPQVRCPTVGSVHAQSQALEVLSFTMDENERTWAKIRAFRQEDGEEITGWIPADTLSVQVPDRTYGVLIDVKRQVLKLYSQGTCLGEIPVSTARGTQWQPSQVTIPGAYFTGARVTDDTSSYGTQSYQLRYDGYRTLAQEPYQRRSGVYYFPYLSGRLSGEHADIFVTASGEETINAFWLYSHLREGTRVLVVNGEQRAMERQRQAEEVPPQNTEEKVSIRFGGLMRPAEDETLPASLYTDSQVYDLTAVALGGYLSDNDATRRGALPETYRGDTALAGAYGNAGIGVMSLADTHAWDGSYAGLLSTARVLEENSIVPLLQGDADYLKLQDKTIAFVAVNETQWRADAAYGMQAVEDAKKQADVVIVMVSWEKPEQNWHDALQETLAVQLAQHGADLIVGSGAGVQGISDVQGVPVLWNLGDLVDGIVASASFAFSQGSYAGVQLQVEASSDGNALRLFWQDAEIDLAETLWFPVSTGAKQQ